MKDRIIIGTRASKLALWQASYIAECLRTAYADKKVELRHIATIGDKILDVPLAKIGGKGLFTKELESEMLAGKIDLAVHSLKDMPTVLPEGLTLAAVTKRADPGDAVVSPTYRTLDQLPVGARVGTSSLRRKAQLLHVRPDLEICDLRGNVGTRLEKMRALRLDAIILAASGLKRLGLETCITEILPHEVCLPAVGQGALAVECRSDDTELLRMLEFLNDAQTAAATAAERAFLMAVEGGCQVPVGVYAAVEGETLLVRAIIASLDGKTLLRDRITGAAGDAQALGGALAARMLDAGGREILISLGCMQTK